MNFTTTSWADKIGDLFDHPNEDLVFFFLMVLGGVLLVCGFLYCLSRILCHTFCSRHCCCCCPCSSSSSGLWASTSSGFLSKSRKSLLVKNILFQNGVRLDPRESWKALSRRASNAARLDPQSWTNNRRGSDLSFSAHDGEEDDQIIYQNTGMRRLEDPTFLESTRRSSSLISDTIEIPPDTKQAGGRRH